VYEQKLAAGDQDAIDSKGVSPVAWRNINPIDKIELTEVTSKVDIGRLPHDITTLISDASH